MKVQLGSFLQSNASYNNLSFRNTRKTSLKCGLALFASSMLFTACNNFKNNHEKNTDKIESTDSNYEDTFKNSSYKVYHYEKARNSVNLSDYDWCETIFPDGRIVRDSAGLKIYISPRGERIVEHKSIDRYGNETITKEFPDGTKIVRKNFFLKNPNENQYTEKIYNKQDILIENKYYNKICLNGSKDKFTTEELYEKYNDNGILLKWITNKKIEPTDTISIYDEQGRIIYDKYKNEHYKYTGEDTIPSISYQIYKGCKCITKYNSDHTAYETYFEASNGTITK